MNGVRKFRESFLEAAALGLLATATLYVAPLQIANRLDGWLFDAWTQLAPRLLRRICCSFTSTTVGPRSRRRARAG